MSLTIDVTLLSFFSTQPHAQCLASSAWTILILGAPISGETGPALIPCENYMGKILLNCVSKLLH